MLTTALAPLSLWLTSHGRNGTRLMDGTKCKRLTEPAKKRFRGIWVRLPTP